VSRLPRTDLLLGLACAAAAAVLGASELMTTFEFTPPGGEALEAPADTAAERHNYAMLVLAAFALLALVSALWTGSQIASFAVAASGVIALLIFLIGDLPDAGKIGTLDDESESFVDARADPQAGFWLELIGSLTLAVCGVALATLRPAEVEGTAPGPRPRQTAAPEPARNPEPAEPEADSTWQWPSSDRSRATSGDEDRAGSDTEERARPTRARRRWERT
jgi:hypothetical protein